MFKETDPQLGVKFLLIVQSKIVQKFLAYLYIIVKLRKRYHANFLYLLQKMRNREKTRILGDNYVYSLDPALQESRETFKDFA